MKNIQQHHTVRNLLVCNNIKLISLLPPTTFFTKKYFRNMTIDIKLFFADPKPNNFRIKVDGTQRTDFDENISYYSCCCLTLPKLSGQIDFR